MSCSFQPSVFSCKLLVFSFGTNLDGLIVLLSSPEYEKLLEELEDLEDIRAYDEAMASGETPVPFEEAIERIERERKGK